ncbi:uncharacterized protein LOC141529705 [Cotesia typhae]|uniref:uncharacterized protein LOC141529705 n=1 Tax=Cotesia typhae TaxID=2053667 RepID=UPI003D690F70
MKVVIDFITYELPNGVFALKEFGMSSVGENENGNYETSHYVFKSPCDWLELPLEFQLTYKEQFKHHGIPWEAGSTEYNDTIQVIIEDLEHVTGIFVDSPKSKVILEDIIGKNKPINPIEGLAWLNNDRKSTRKACKVHQGDKFYCAYNNARRMSFWIKANEVLGELIGSKPTITMMKHININNTF